MREISIGFSKPVNRFFPIVSYLIRLIEGTEYSHVYLKWYSEKYKTFLVYQASSSFVNFMGTKNFFHHNREIKEYRLQVTDDEFDEFMRWAIVNSGTGYGVMQLVGLAYVKIMKKVGLKVSNPFRNGTKRQVCVELVGYFLKNILGTRISDDLDSMGLREIESFVASASLRGVNA